MKNFDVAIRALFAIAVVAGSVGCKEKMCTPGEVQVCPCAGGGSGTQVCEDDASGWGACGCENKTDGKTNNITSAPPQPSRESSVPSAEVVSKPTGSLTGSGMASLPPGKPGELTVVGYGKYQDESSVGVVVRNMTGKTVYSISVSGTARDHKGTIVGAGKDQGFSPRWIKDGDAAIGYVFFKSKLPGGLAFEWQVTSRDVESRFQNDNDLEVTEFNVVPGALSGKTVVGVLKNNGVEASKLNRVTVLCFDASGHLEKMFFGFSSSREIAPGATGNFSINTYKSECAQLVIGASGHH